VKGGCLALLALATACGSGAAPTSDDAVGRLPEAVVEEEAQVVATVEGRPITLARLSRAVDAWGAAAQPRQVLEDLITLEVIAAEAERRGLAGDPEVRAAGRRGRIRRLLEETFESRTASHDVPEAALRRAYDENSSFYNNPDVMLVTHIIAPVERKEPPERWEAARALLEELRGEVLALEERTGKGLRVVAKRHQARWTGLRTENLRWIGRKSPLVREFLDAAFALRSDGEVSPPTKTQFGWHLILREKFEAERHQPFETVVDDVRERMYTAWRRQEFLEWVDGLVEQWAVVDPEPLASLRPAPRPR